MDAKVASYISSAIIDMLDSGFDINISKGHLGSYLDDSNKFLQVGLRNQNKVFDWFPDFIHEYCHFLQHKEGQFTGKKWTEIYRLFNKIKRGKRLSRSINRNRIIRKVQNVELDAEKRVIQEIEKHNLPVDIKRYAQRANAYIYFHNFLIERRRDIFAADTWENQEVFNLMPCRFLLRYDRMPSKYRRLIIKLYKEENKK